MRKKLFVPARGAGLIPATPFFASVTKYDIQLHSDPTVRLDLSRRRSEIELSVITRAASPL